MKSGFFDELKAYIGFDDRDAKNLRLLSEAGRSLIPHVVGRFYDVLLEHEESRAVLANAAQIERLRLTLGNWLRELFSGAYDDNYLQSRIRIGQMHVRIALPQRFMPLAMEVVWRELCQGLRAVGTTEIEEGLGSLHKLLTLDLTIMLWSFQECHTQQVRTFEKNEMEAKLLRNQHLAEIGQLAASLAHEIKNPLAGISGAIQIIGESLESQSPYKPIVRDILGQISRLDATVKDLLLYARPLPPRRKTVKIDEVISRTINLLKEEPALCNIRVRFGGAGHTIHADEGQLEQLLMNLILNAAHASAEGTTIDVHVADQGDSLRLMVQDRGAGMSAHVMDRAMEPFFTTKAKGTGLGLAICRRIVESHGGAITIESAPGKGTSVLMEFPRGAEGAAAGGSV